MPGDIDLSSLSDEADRLLTDLSDVSRSAQSESDAARGVTPESETSASESGLEAAKRQGITESDERYLLFTAAVSELKRQGALRFGSLPPSLERSRTTMSSFVVCDIQSKVIGRVPLATLYPKIQQSQLTSDNQKTPTPPALSPSTHHQPSLSNHDLDRSTLILINDCTPQERALFMSEYNAGRKSVASGVVLALLFGGLGVHKFWLGNVALGMIYLVFCWTFIPGIVALLDACLMGNSVQRYNQKVAEAAYRRIKLLR